MDPQFYFSLLLMGQGESYTFQYSQSLCCLVSHKTISRDFSKNITWYNYFVSPQILAAHYARYFEDEYLLGNVIFQLFLHHLYCLCHSMVKQVLNENKNTFLNFIFPTIYLHIRLAGIINFFQLFWLKMSVFYIFM